MEIKEVMNNWVKVDHETNIAELAKKLDKNSTGSALIFEGEEPVGVVTERDIIRKIVVPGKNVKETKVKHIMSSPVITVDINEDVRKASEMMDKKRIRRLAVVENGKIVGKITTNVISRNLRYYLGRDFLKLRSYWNRHRVKRY